MSDEEKEIVNILRQIETEELVRVVRCKDCKHHRKDTCSAGAGMAVPPPDDWYCADGERKKGR